jgi:hypothetical protein
VNQEFDKAADIYGSLVIIKQTYYGIESESLVGPLKNLGQAQHMNNQYEEAE